MSETKEKVMDVLNKMTDLEKRVFVKVLKAERNKIHLKSPHGIIDDLLVIFKEEIK